MSDHCWLGPLNLHTYNHERTECIWCGPGRLAWKPGVWVEQGDGLSAWSVTPDRSQVMAADLAATDAYYRSHDRTIEARE